MSIGKLLTGLFAAIIVVVTLQGIYALLSLGSIGEVTRRIVDKRGASIIVLGQLNADNGNMRVLQGSILDTTGETRAALEARLATIHATIEGEFATYDQMVVDDIDRAALAAIKQSWAKSQTDWQDVLAAERSGGPERAMALFLGPSLASYSEASKAIQAGVDDLAFDMRNEGAETEDMIDATRFATYAALAMALVISLVSVAVTMLRVVRPLNRMAGAMRALAEGDVGITVSGRKRRDEIGAMAAALQVFKEGILRNRTLEAQAQAERDRAEADKLRVQQEAEAAAQHRLQQATAGLAAGLRRLAAGDLSTTLSEPFSSEFEALRHDLNSAIAQLGDTIAQVASAAGAIDTGAQEVRHGADDLSRRTEQQAAALEETAAALDEITVNVSQAAKRVEEARSVAQEASASATRSGAVVGSAIDAMQRIEQSARQISNIIGVIDEIAFQTNLLALNAGVEAARAGEAGRGFAVVATEVRELAQRSANAAREIKELIGKSTAEVETGVKLVRQTGDALTVIDTHVATINQLMDAITTASREQATGLAEVNTAVNQMDQVTQQNAAMVEETSAASSTLAHESGRLRSLVARFVLRGMGQAAALPRVA